MKSLFDLRDRRNYFPNSDHYNVNCNYRPRYPNNETLLPALPITRCFSPIHPLGIIPEDSDRIIFPPALKAIIIACEICSTKITLRWHLYNEFSLRRNVRYIIEVREYNKDVEKFHKHVVSWRATTDFEAVSGHKYDLTIRCVENNTKNVIAEGRHTVKVVFSNMEQYALLEKAYHFVGPNMHPFQVVYRCKPKAYWDEIHFIGNGLMIPYEKDTNGQPANRINEEINGLFFNARTTHDGSLPTQSPFGEIRIKIPAMRLLDPSRYSFYFSDFYCNQKLYESHNEKRPHYVTVVVTLVNSPADIYCKSSLIRLDIFNNAFLRYVTHLDTFFVSSTVWVEIFFTELVPLNWGQFDNVIASGFGTSKCGGLPNNKFCEVCNLHPQKRPVDNQLSITNETSNKQNISDVKSPAQAKCSDLLKNPVQPSKYEPSSETLKILPDFSDEVSTLLLVESSESNEKEQSEPERLADSKPMPLKRAHSDMPDNSEPLSKIPAVGSGEVVKMATRLIPELEKKEELMQGRDTNTADTRNLLSPAEAILNGLLQNDFLEEIDDSEKSSSQNENDEAQAVKDSQKNNLTVKPLQERTSNC